MPYKDKQKQLANNRLWKQNKKNMENFYLLGKTFVHLLIRYYYEINIAKYLIVFIY